MGYALTKRALDIMISAVACLLLLPLFGLIAAVICLESSGSPIFTQQRVGLHGRPFAIFKFRSMVKNAPLLGSYQTADNDPRITRVGRFIRATSLDELPQLWNVLFGHMSLIGPRPEMPARQSQCSAADWQLRHNVRPGITGLAQVSGRSNLSDEEQFRCDLEYAAQVSLKKDAQILLKTCAIVLRRVGVN
jgi:lipopolysaccharide/colanic/teichoic acid biosynthesis glycosyltransferase